MSATDERLGHPELRGPSRESSLPLDRVPDVQKNLEIELLAAVSKVERGHLGFVAGGLGALERFAVHLVEVGQDPFAGAGHADSLEGVKGQSGNVVARASQVIAFDLLFDLVEQESARPVEEHSSGLGEVVH